MSAQAMHTGPPSSMINSPPSSLPHREHVQALSAETTTRSARRVSAVVVGSSSGTEETLQAERFQKKRGRAGAKGSGLLGFVPEPPKFGQCISIRRAVGDLLGANDVLERRDSEADGAKINDARALEQVVVAGELPPRVAWDANQHVDIAGARPPARFSSGAGGLLTQPEGGRAVPAAHSRAQAARHASPLRRRPLWPASTGVSSSRGGAPCSWSHSQSSSIDEKRNRVVAAVRGMRASLGRLVPAGRRNPRSERFLHVSRLEIRIRLDDLRCAHPLGDHADDRCHWDAEIPDARHAAHLVGPDRDPRDRHCRERTPKTVSRTMSRTQQF